MRLEGGREITLVGKLRGRERYLKSQFGVWGEIRGVTFSRTLIMQSTRLCGVVCVVIQPLIMCDHFTGPCVSSTEG